MTKYENFRWGRFARRLGVALVVAYFCSAAVLVLGEEVMIRWHDRGAVKNGSGTDVWLRTEDGVRIYARYYARDPELPTLLYFHGGAGNLASRSDRLELFASLGANVFAIDYRGYGPSEGTSTEHGLELDASAAYA
jgi:acetyl esterase/lipase